MYGHFHEKICYSRVDHTRFKSTYNILLIYCYNMSNILYNNNNFIIDIFFCDFHTLYKIIIIICALQVYYINLL